MSTAQKIADVEAEMARTQKNKATNGHLALLKTKMAKLKRELIEGGKGKGGPAGDGFDVTKASSKRHPACGAWQPPTCSRCVPRCRCVALARLSVADPVLCVSCCAVGGHSRRFNWFSFSGKVDLVDQADRYGFRGGSVRVYDVDVHPWDDPVPRCQDPTP